MTIVKYGTVCGALAAIIAFAALLFATPAWADDTYQCLNELSGPLVDVTGTEYAYNPLFNLSNGSRLDARGDVYTGQTDPALPDGSIVGYIIDLRSDLANSICWAGGVIHYTNDYDITWGESKTPNNAALMTWTGDAIFDGVRIHNAHDAIRPRRNTDMFWEVRNSWITYNRDDCIESDFMAAGLVDDSLFDGCNVFLSSRNLGDYIRMPRNIVTVQNSLIRMQEMPGPYGHPDRSIMGHGPLFKYQNQSPNLVLRNNIFLMESYVTTKNVVRSEASSFEQLGFRVSQGQLKECSGNIIVWTGPGEFPGDIPNDPSCVTVTTDRAVWEDARAKWIAEHPLVARIDGVDDPAPAPDPEPAPEPDPIPEPEPALDTTPPLVEILSPPLLVQRKTNQIIEVDALDDVAILRVEIYINGNLEAVLDGPGFIDWRVPGNPHGRYEITATAIDTSGNFSTDTITVFATK